MDRKPILSPVLPAFVLVALSLLTVALAAPPSQAAAAASDAAVYKVQRGDSLFKIAIRYGITVDQLMTVNNLTSSEIHPGQRLAIPAGAGTDATTDPGAKTDSGTGAGTGSDTGAGSGFYYTVRPGDTLYLLGKRFGTTGTRIAAANGITATAWLSVGQVLYVPGASETPAPPTAPAPPEPGAWQYTVVSSDTLFLLARRFGTTVDKLYQLNGLKSDYLEPGMVLWLPGPGEPSVPPSPADPPVPVQPPAASTPPAASDRFTPQELDMMARLVQAEAGGEPYDGQVAVAAVVLNRLNDPRFPKTVSGVVYEPWAFESVENGWFNYPAGSTALQAVNDALAGSDPTHGAVFFYNPVGTTNQFMLSRPVAAVIGNHVFAY